MPTILGYYLAGLSIALAIGAVCYCVVGHAATPLLRVLFGHEAGRMWGRLFRISVVTIALVGALTTKFYGCRGPTDYADVAKDHEKMLERTTSQVAGALDSTVNYLLLAATIGAIAFGIRHARQGAHGDSVIRAPAEQR
jgi:hypothetical protein